MQAVTLKADLKPLSGPQVFGYGRWRRGSVKISSEIAQRHRVWTLSIRPHQVNVTTSTRTKATGQSLSAHRLLLVSLEAIVVFNCSQKENDRMKIPGNAVQERSEFHQ